MPETWASGRHVLYIMLNEKSMKLRKGSVCIGKGGGFSIVATSIRDIPRGSETSVVYSMTLHLAFFNLTVSHLTIG